MQIQEYEMPLHRHPKTKLPLLPHQCVLFDAWDKNQSFILTTKTGSGKTAAVTLPVIHRKESAIFIYPTNALIQDQEQSIVHLMQKEGLKVKVLTPHNINDKYGDEDYHLIRIDAARLEEFRQVMKLRKKGDALLRILQPAKAKIILINPDIVYLIFALKYGEKSAELISHFQAYPTAVFDEFHLYQGIELAHSLFLIHLVQEFGGFQRIVLLSATPTSEVMHLIDKALNNPLVIDMNSTCRYPQVGKRLIAHRLEFSCNYVGRDEVATISEYLQQTRNSLQQKRSLNADSTYVPCVVILNSVISAIRLEDNLVALGWKRNEIGVIRGLMAKKDRTIDNKLVVIGTSAIEVGIDFRTDLLIFLASDRSSFLQRLGRLGRHAPGTAILFGDSREYAAFQSFPDSLSRDQFEEYICNVYVDRDAFPWFPGTTGGMLTMISQAEAIREQVLRDYRASETIKKELDGWLDKVILSFGSKMGWEKEITKIHKLIKTVRHGSLGKWISDYFKHTSFRGSLPTITVYDYAEKRRGRTPKYQADLLSLLKWGNLTGSNYETDSNIIFINGFRTEYPHKIWLLNSFDDEKFGYIYTTSNYPDLAILQDGRITPISNAFTVRPYIFTLVPLDFARRLDWRLPWIKCGMMGNKAAVFDSPALIVQEMWKRSGFHSP